MDAEERSMGMLLQSLPKKAYFLIYALFFILWVLILFLGIIMNIRYWDSTLEKGTWGCANTATTTFSPELCSGVDLFQSGSYWTGLIKNIDKLNRELYLEASVVNGDNTTSIDTKLDWTVSFRGSDNSSDDTAWSDWIEVTKTRDLTCTAGEGRCDSIILVHELYIKYSTYEVNISISNVPSSLTSIQRGQIYMTFYYVNHSYTLMQLWFRFVFLIFTFIFIIVFAHRLRRTSWRDWTLEQRWTSILLFSILGYSNPFFALTILVVGWFPVFLDVVLAATFFCLLLLFWLILFDGITKEARDRGVFKFYFWKILLVGLMWIAMVVVYTWIHLHQLDDPNYDVVQDLPGFIFFEVVLIILLLVYLLWLFFVFFKSCSDLKQKAYLGTRIRFFGGFTVFVLIVTLAALIFGWAEPNVGTSSSSVTALQFMGLSSLYHLYVFVLCIMYLPTKRGAAGKRSDYGMQRLEDQVAGADSSDEAAPHVDLPASDSTVSESKSSNSQ